MTQVPTASSLDDQLGELGERYDRQLDELDNNRAVLQAALDELENVETVTAADIRIGDVVNFTGCWLDTVWATVTSPLIRSKYAIGLSAWVEVHFDDGTSDVVSPGTVVRRRRPVARGQVCDECGSPSLGPLCSTHRRIDDGPYDEDFE